MKEQPHICPLCGRAYDEPPALSRVDNQTDICPRCGMMEALAAMPRRETPQERTRRAVYATGNRWAIENFEATHHYLGDVTFSNAEDWIVREGSDTEDDESARARTLRSWSELAQRATEDTFIDAAESVPGVLFAQADCNHPRGQGTVDVIVTGTAGEATEGLLAAVREAVDKIAGPYDNILVRSSVTVSQNISVTITTDTADTDEAVENRVKAILTELLAVRRSRKLNELTLSDINHAIRSGYSGATNAAVSEPEADVKLGKDKVITLGDVSVTVERE